MKPEEADNAEKADSQAEEGVEDVPSCTLEDYKEIRIDLTFGVQAAAKAFNINGRFELFHHLVDEYSDREAVKFLSDYLHPSKSSTYGNVSAFSFCVSRSFVAVSAFYNVSYVLL